MDIKLAIAVRDDLVEWQKCNVTAFLASGLAGAFPKLMGNAYVDADGGAYLPLLGHPIVVLTGDQSRMDRSLRRARDRGLAVAIYIDAMFATGNDVDNRATVAAVRSSELRCAGLAVRGERRDVDKALDRLVMHP